MRTEEGFLFRLYRQSKVYVNYLLDRVIDLCNLFLMDVYRIPWSTAQNIARWVARWVGDIACLLRAFPRLSTYRIEGRDCTIVFVGLPHDLLEVRNLFFPQEEVCPQEVGRTALWQLSRRTQQWLADGADLVICQLCRIYPIRPWAPIHFTIPAWVHQVLAIPESPQSLISGKSFATERHRLNKAQRDGFSYRFSQSNADFDHFHHHLYLPYVNTRHGERALTGRYQDQWQRWFVRGGLLLVTQHDEPVAGVLCYLANGTCFDVERGVLEVDPQLFRQGIETMITWYAINWARDQGAKIYNMGGSRSWRSNGSFNSKRHWGAKVVRYRRIYPTWTFLARDLPASLQEYINRLGFISEIGRGFYGVVLAKAEGTVEERDVSNELMAAKEHGLDGLVVLSANAQPAVIRS